MLQGILDDQKAEDEKSSSAEDLPEISSFDRTKKKSLQEIMNQVVKEK